MGRVESACEAGGVGPVVNGAAGWVYGLDTWTGDQLDQRARLLRFLPGTDDATLIAPAWPDEGRRRRR